MSNSLKKNVSLLFVPNIFFNAGIYVIENFGSCLFRAIPVIVLVALIGFINIFTYGIFLYHAKFLYAFLFAIFAVSWHRYTLIPREWMKGGIPFSFRLREIKYGGILFVTLIAIFMFNSLLAGLMPEKLAALLTFALFCPILLLLAFIFSAIAIDRPLEISHFARVGRAYIPSFILGLVFFGAFLYLVSFFLKGFTEFIADEISLLASFVTYVVLGEILLSSIAVAIIVSAASFLYRDVIGLQEEAGSTTSQ